MQKEIETDERDIFNLKRKRESFDKETKKIIYDLEIAEKVVFNLKRKKESFDKEYKKINNEITILENEIRKKITAKEHFINPSISYSASLTKNINLEPKINFYDNILKVENLKISNGIISFVINITEKVCFIVIDGEKGVVIKHDINEFIYNIVKEILRYKIMNFGLCLHIREYGFHKSLCVNKYYINFIRFLEQKINATNIILFNKN